MGQFNSISWRRTTPRSKFNKGRNMACKILFGMAFLLVVAKAQDYILTDEVDAKLAEDACPDGYKLAEIPNDATNAVLKQFIQDLGDDVEYWLGNIRRSSTDDWRWYYWLNGV